MNKPDWEDAPEWAQWLACDEYGPWGWYAKKPRIFGDYCWDIHDSNDPDDKWSSVDAEWVKNDDWMETLEQRP